MLPGWDWLNTDAEIMADFRKLCAMDRDRRISVKVKHGRKTVDKWILDDTNLFDIVRDDDFQPSEEQMTIVRLKDLSIYLVKKNESSD